MIKLLQKEYDEWAQILRDNAEKRQALKDKLDRDSDELLRSYGVDPDADDELLSMPADYIKKNEKLLDKYESALIALDIELDEKQYPIIQTGIDRAIRGKNPKTLYEEAKATIYSHAYDEMSEDAAGAYAIFGGLLTGSVDLNVDDHIVELRNKGEAALADDLQELVDRYIAGEITRSEAEPYKDFEYIVIEVPLPKKVPGKTAIETVDSVRVTTVAIAEQNVTANADLVKKIFSGKSNDPMITSVLKITEGKGNNRKLREVKVSAAINYDGLDNLTVLNRAGAISLYDRLVFNAVASQYDAGNVCMSLDMIADAMRGYSIKGKPSEKQCEAILASLRKLSVLRIQVDTTAAADIYPELKSIRKETYALNMDFVTVSYRNNTWQTAIRVNETPLLLQYAQGVNQVVRKDIKLLATPVQATQENILLQGYLYDRVLGASGRSNYNTILVSSILEELDIVPENFSSRSAYTNKKSKILAATVKILDYWTEQDFIKGYDAVTEQKGKNPSVIKFVLK